MAVLRTTRDFEDLLLPILPAAFCSTREDWILKVIAPQFVQSFGTVGDVCVFGCIPQMLPAPLAFIAGALGVVKTVYAFDTFDVDAATSDVFEDLGRWSSVLPVRPIRGDVSETCRLLIDRVSFIWFDLAEAEVIERILDTLWPLLGTNTVIGINGTGRPETPQLQSLVEYLVAKRRLASLSKLPDNFISFLRPVAP